MLYALHQKYIINLNFWQEKKVLWSVCEEKEKNLCKLLLLYVFKVISYIYIYIYKELLNCIHLALSFRELGDDVAVPVVCWHISDIYIYFSMLYIYMYILIYISILWARRDAHSMLIYIAPRARRWRGSAHSMLMQGSHPGVRANPKPKSKPST